MDEQAFAPRPMPAVVIASLEAGEAYIPKAAGTLPALKAAAGPRT